MQICLKLENQSLKFTYFLAKYIKQTKNLVATEKNKTFCFLVIVQKIAEKIKIPKKPLTLREYYYIIYLYCYDLRMSWRRNMTYNIYTSVCKLGVLRAPMYNKFSYAAKAVYYVFSKNKRRR